MAKRGRPTKYNARMQKLADEYVDGYYIERGDGVPSVAGLARYLDVTRQTLWHWGEQSDQFLTTLGNIESEQHRIALGKGITGEYNSTICKLVLANHGYSERVQSDLVSSDGTMSPQRIEIVSGNGKNGKEADSQD